MPAPQKRASAPVAPVVATPAVTHAASPVSQGSGAQLSTVKTIGNTDVKYNICTFGAKFHIGFGVEVPVVMNGRIYQLKTHNSAKGRIDGFKQLYADNQIQLGDQLKATYCNQMITLERI